jgi:hypothetical protein
MGKKSDFITCLRRMADVREYNLNLPEILRSSFLQQSRNSVQHQNIVSAIALDKIPPLSHLHSPRHPIRCARCDRAKMSDATRVREAAE